MMTTMPRVLSCALCCLLLSSCGTGVDERTDRVDAPPTGAPDPGIADSGTPEAGATNNEPAADSGPVHPVSPDVTTAADTDEARPAAGGAASWTARDTRVERSTPGVSILRELRTARHDGFDRIVLDFGDDAVPGYGIAYIDRPVRQCGSGNPVRMAGDGWLEIEVTPAHAHTDEGEPTVTSRSREPGLPNLRQLELTCDFEAHVVWVAGVGSPNPYRAFELSSPNRLVVDIRHAGGS